VTGALLAFPREAVRRLGGFSTAYPLTYEDVDYCLNAWTHGLRVWYEADWSALHVEAHTRGKTTGQKYARSLMWAERERYCEEYFDRKWHALRYIHTLDHLMAQSAVREDRRNLPPRRQGAKEERKEEEKG
jgi:GT2 family glycosyltransferase